MSLTVFYCPSHLNHDPHIHMIGSGNHVQHVEKPRRAVCVIEVLQGLGNVNVINSYREATVEELMVVHDAKFVHFILHSWESLTKFHPDASELVPEVIAPIASHVKFLPDLVHLQSGHFAIDYATPIGKCTAQEARRSAAIAIDGAKFLLENPDHVVVSVCRPPGHHASREKYGGYCYFNNVRHLS
eukprot:TRINITY_DN350_c0_g1_i3.p1 TRINITY_DN350_c0_g1~~TRINITY_DN350_c0_g1_i3.p1  ORF type:complete len:201 (-),score=27.22 TRINITY_DN350_c0_g1_i3:357-914(-)